MIGWLFLALLVSVSAYILRFGHLEERVALSTLIVNFVATFLLYNLGSKDWLKPHYGIFAIDTITMAILLAIAFRSKRFWPLPVAAFQIITVLAQLVGFFGQNLVSYALGVAQGASSYVQLLILVLAARKSRSLPASPAKTSSSSPI